MALPFGSPALVSLQCWFHVGFMLVSCRSHLGFTMLVSCWFHVGFLLLVVSAKELESSQGFAPTFCSICRRTSVSQGSASTTTESFATSYEQDHVLPGLESATADSCEIHFAPPFRTPGMIRFPYKYQQNGFLWFQYGAKWISLAGRLFASFRKQT